MLSKVATLLSSWLACSYRVHDTAVFQELAQSVTRIRHGHAVVYDVAHEHVAADRHVLEQRQVCRALVNN